jgi:hypothetical protein
MNITTPHHDGYPFVLSSLIANLQAMSQAAMTQYNTQNAANPKTYYVAKAFSPVEQKQLREDPARVQQMQQSYAAAQVASGVAPTPMTPVMTSDSEEGDAPALPPAQSVVVAAGAPNPIFVDRLTGEDRQNDWEMKVVFIVVVTDATKPQPAAQAAVGN